MNNMESESSTSNKILGSLNQLLPAVAPMLLISIGYVDPGKWAATIEGGAHFEFDLAATITMYPIVSITTSFVAEEHSAEKMSIEIAQKVEANRLNNLDLEASTTSNHVNETTSESTLQNGHPDHATATSLISWLNCSDPFPEVDATSESLGSECERITIWSVSFGLILKFIASTQPINTLAFVLDGVNFGASDFAYTAYSMIIMAIASITSEYLLAKARGYIGIWYALIIYMGLRTVAGVWRVGIATGPWRFLRGRMLS